MAYVEDTDLASTSPGKGASMVGIEDGGTVQWEMIAGVGELAALAPSDRDTARIRGGGGCWVFHAGNYAARVAVDTAQGVFVAPAGDPTGASGAWVRAHEGVLRPEWFGDLDTPSTATAAIQMAINLTQHVEAKVVLPNREIETDYTIFTVDHLEMVGEGSESVIWNNFTGANNPRKAVMGVGALNMQHLSSNTNNGKTTLFTWRSGGAVTHGDYSVTLTNATDAANFTKGDKVYVRSQAYRVGGSNAECPHFGQANIVAANGDPVTGVVSFEYPVLGSYDSSYLCNFTTASIADTAGSYTGPVIGPHVGVRLSGFGLKSTHPSGNAFSRCCVLDGDIDVRAEAPTGAWLNACTLSRVRVVWMGGDKVLELPCNCTGSVFEVHGTYQRGVNGAASNQPPIKIGENSNYNTCDIYMTGDVTSVTGAVVIDSGVSNVLNLRRLEAPSLTSAVIYVDHADRAGVADAGETQDALADVTVNVFGTVITTEPARLLYMVNDGGCLSRFSLRGGRFSGEPDQTMLTFAGDGHICEGVAFPPGSISTTAATNLRLDINGGPFTYSALGGLLEWTVDGVRQSVAGTALAHTSGDFAVNMSLPSQTITVSGSGINFILPTSSAVGSTANVTLTNASGASWTPTANANWALGGYTFPSIGAGQSITFTVRRVPATVGVRVAVTGATPPA